MTRILQATKIEETVLWKRLNEQQGSDARSLSANVIALCEEATDRAKAMVSYAPQFTLHDDRHLLRVVELMSMILGNNINNLNTIELTLLILSAFFHDQGMIPSKEEFFTIKDDNRFELFRDHWLIDHPNYKETATQLKSCYCTQSKTEHLARQLAELDSAMFTAYLRVTHGSRSAALVRSTYRTDKRMDVQSVNLAETIARLCESHTLPCKLLTPDNGFHYDEEIGRLKINMPFLAVILRLSDLLDFDRDRTPETLLKNIHFTSDVSLHEWEKHRSVIGWSISNKLIRFTIRCKHPVYEAAARTHMDWIDKELIDCHDICQMQPHRVQGYKLNLPSIVDRSRIEPLDNAYHCHNLEFNLSRDEVVRLLMTDKLYNGQHLCIRELLQNSLDALRYRKALYGLSGTNWENGKIDFRHYVNSDGYEILECNDNGSGMDEDIIQNYFVKVGRSFYRSPDFERERMRLKISGKDFDPCSKFGIGFMSCFMLGDRITIKTRRDYGFGREWGPPLVVEIHGLSGLLVVHRGLNDQPIGTSVSIVSRQKPSFIDSWTDKIKLCAVLKCYALATEFPIVGQCEIIEIKEKVTIPPIPDIIPTKLESAKIKNAMHFEQNLSEVSEFLGGYVRDSLLIDNNNLPCIGNSEAEWRGITEGNYKKWDICLLTTNRKFQHELFRHSSVPVCADGILIAGTPGRFSYRQDIRTQLGERNSGVYSCSPALIDSRGELKPELTPGRTPPDHHLGDLPPGWKRLQDEINNGLGLLWQKLITHLGKGLAPVTFWQFATIHEIIVSSIPYKSLWNELSVSLIKPQNPTCWSHIRELGELEMYAMTDGTFMLQNKKGAKIGPDEELSNWEKQGSDRPNLEWQMKTIVLLMSCLYIRDQKVVLCPIPPADPELKLWQYVGTSSSGVTKFFLNYGGEASDAVAVETPYPTANRNHPLAVIGHNARYVCSAAQTDLQSFAKAFISCISESVSTKEQTPSLSKLGYWHKRVGHLYFSVQWDQYDPKFKPPYKIWTKSGGWLSLQESDLAKWRDTPL